MNGTLGIGATIEAAWKMFTKRAWFYIGITILVFFLGWLIGFVSGFFNALIGYNLTGNATGTALSFIGQVLLSMGTIAFFLKAHDTNDAKVRDLWHPQPLWYYIGVVLLDGVIVVFGLILLIVPGIIFALMFLFVQYIVMDREISPVAALKESYRITMGHKWKLAGLMLALMLINIIGAICLLVGLLVTVPLTSLATVHAYRTLSKTAYTRS